MKGVIFSALLVVTERIAWFVCNHGRRRGRSSSSRPKRRCRCLSDLNNTTMIDHFVQLIQLVHSVHPFPAWVTLMTGSWCLAVTLRCFLPGEAVRLIAFRISRRGYLVYNLLVDSEAMITGLLPLCYCFTSLCRQTWFTRSYSSKCSNGF